MVYWYVTLQRCIPNKANGINVRYQCFSRQRSHIQGPCSTEVTKAANYFIKLHAANQWIFGVNQSIIVDIICESRIQPTALERYGFIKLQPGCILKSNTVHLYAISTKGSERNGSYIPAFNISVLTQSLDKAHRLTSTHQISFTITTPDTTQLEQEIRAQQLDESVAMDQHHVHHYVMTHLAFWTLLALGIFLLIRCVKGRRHSAQTTRTCGRPPTCSTEHGTCV